MGFSGFAGLPGNAAGFRTGLYTESMSDWDGAKYHRISDPQLAWGRAVAVRLAPASGERILDLGCGTGRLTAEIARTPGIRMVGLDRSAAMLQVARAGDSSGGDDPAQTRRAGAEGHAPVYVRGDGAALPFVNAFDAVFSAATFHWISDHQRLFTSIFAALKRGGRLVAQAGGVGNLATLYGRALDLMRSPEYAEFFGSWSNPTHFENVRDTEERLARAGFEDFEVSVVESPVTFADAHAYSEFAAAVCLRHQLDRLPADRRDRFMNRITEAAAADSPALTLDYWRLNIFARKGNA
jgi:trans-aconitate 2-methyltransferase